MPLRPEPLALYVHWPFCRSKCPYCDFNSHVRDAVDQARWRAALLRELESTATTLAPRRLETVFFGGGTPSLMPPETAAARAASGCGRRQRRAMIAIGGARARGNCGCGEAPLRRLAANGRLGA